MTGVNVSGSSAATGRFWRLAMLTAAGAFGATTHAEAALYYWPDYSDGSYYYRQPQPLMQRPKPRKHAPVNKNEVIEKDTGAKPQGPLVISVSIDRQKVTVYDANGAFAEAPISTGMKGHPTPMGVFSVIQKHKLHHSNIYSGAPMPYMQRITWSGVAMHAGVLPGYPASHGCIRMPMAFAVKLWNWTKMGARVIVAPGDMSPVSFSHPLLATLKVPPQPAASLELQFDAPLGAKGDKGDKGADAGAPEIKSASAEPVIELRSTVGHTVMSDATTGNAPAREDAPAASEAAKENDKTDEVKTADAGAAKPESDETAVKTEEAAKPAETAVTEAKPAESADATKAMSEEKPAEKVEAAKTEPVKTEPVKTEAATTEPAKSEPTEAAKSETAKAETPNAEPTKAEPAKAKPAKAEAKAEPVKAEPVKSEAAEAAKKPDVAVTAATPAQPSAPDAKKDQTRLAAPAPAAKPEPPKRTGQIAVFISRKDSKLYVRQNFAPLFDMPVTIAASDRPLGTHIFTAEVDKTDSNALRWSVVSLPVSVRSVERENEGRTTRRQRVAGVIPVAAKPAIVPNSPAEALDRITIPADTMARINEMLTTGGSIVVSDQGINQGETGEGTDFIVRLR
jgi:lipoprotein-anchoring transpeptidase ErfK/SrfK